MNRLDLSFETPFWEPVLRDLLPGSSFSAARFLALMETEGQEAMEEALALLDEKNILLDIRTLPAPAAAGDTALRLKREAQLVKSGRLLQDLEENDPLRLYLEEIASTPACGDPQILAEDAAKGDEPARARLVNLMLSAVAQQAFAMAGQGVLLLDLIQEGSLGLWQAILEYSGGDFESYCNRYIQRIMAKTVTLQAYESGVGQKMRQAMEDYRAVDERLLGELGRNPTLEEIALELHMTAEAAAIVADTLDAARMLNRVRADSHPKEPEPEDDQAVENTAYFQMRQRVAELLSALTPEDAQVLTLRFGLEGGLPMSAEETARKLQMTPEEVTRRETAALAALRNER